MQKQSLKYLILLSLLVVASSISAQTFTHVPTGNEPDVVYAVFFYSPTCPHCHDVINNVLPDWAAEFGEQLIIIPVDVTVQGASVLYNNACIAFNVPEDFCGSVPLMVIGETWMVGSTNIQTQGTSLIRNKIENEGSPLPEFEDIDSYFELYQVAVAEAIGENAVESGSEIPVIIENRTIAQRLAADPIANTMAIIVLVGLVASFIKVFILRNRLTCWNRGQVVAFFTALLATGIGISLVAQVKGDALAMQIAWVVLVLVVIVLTLLALSIRDVKWLAIVSNWGVPLIALAGLGVAIYLAYVETTATEAVCGVIGNCNAVQQSVYAQLFGVPIGVLGIVGYVLILGTWGLRVINAEGSHITLFVLASGGVIFSAYLTFLEPFIIGATCAWCLMSALTMLLLFWLVAPAGWMALDFLMRDKQL